MVHAQTCSSCIDCRRLTLGIICSLLLSEYWVLSSLSVVSHIFYFFRRSHQRHNQHTDHLCCIAALHIRTFITAESWHILIPHYKYHINIHSISALQAHFVPSSFLIYHSHCKICIPLHNRASLRRRPAIRFTVI
jgi:hypothetical protein